MINIFRLPALVGIVLLNCACSPDAANAPQIVNRDSAGITIVETERAAWEGASGWTVEPEPTLAIGLLEGDPRYLFGKIAGVAQLQDGSIAVVDDQALQIRIYDSTGSYLATSGRSGGGPGEYVSIGGVRRCGGDRLFVEDWQAIRTTILKANGELEQTIRIFEPEAAAPRRPYRLKCSPVGMFIAVGWGDSPDFGTLPNATFYRQDAPVWIMDSIGSPIAELGIFPASERVFMRGTGGGGTSAPHPFGRQTSVEIGVDRAYVATGDQLEIREFSLEGRILRILRGSTEDPIFGASLVSRYLDDEPASFAANLIRSADEMGLELPKALPAVTELLLDPEGYVWAKRFKHPFDESERWAVFSPDGAFLGHVTMPSGFSVHEIGATHVLGVSLGDLNVERVARYRLVRGK